MGCWHWFWVVSGKLSEKLSDHPCCADPKCCVLSCRAFCPHAQANGSAPKARGVLGSFVSSLALRVVGSSALTAEDLAPALVDMKVG